MNNQQTGWTYITESRIMIKIIDALLYRPKALHGEFDAETLADEADISVTSVRRKQNYLVEMGIIELTEDGNQRFNADSDVVHLLYALEDAIANEIHEREQQSGSHP